MLDDQLDGVATAPKNHRVLDTRADPDLVLPSVLWSTTLGRHAIENTGPAAPIVIGVELKQAR